MNWLDKLRALPRPLMQWLLLAMIWPVWLVLGVIEAIAPGAGAAIQTSMLTGLNGMPSEVWAAVIVLGLGAQAYRTIEKRFAAPPSEKDPLP